VKAPHAQSAAHVKNAAARVAPLALAWLRYGGGRLGWPGLLGLLLLLLTAAAWPLLLQPLESAHLAQQRRLEALRDRLQALPAAPPAEVSRLTALAGGAALLPLVGAVHAIAAQHRIVLAQGEYVWQNGGEDRPARYQMIFPVRGGYPDLRAWIAALNRQRPELVLEGFDLRRENIGGETLDGRVRFVVAIGGDSP
jgi:type II secretory pathway component PulM